MSEAHPHDEPLTLPENIGSRWYTAALAVTLTAAVLLGIGFFLDDSVGKREFLFCYLFGYMLGLDVALGALFWVLIHHVADAGWSVVLRRTFENMTRALPILLVLFVPIALGMNTIFRWTQETDDPLLQQKEAYLNPSAFLIRIGLYFLMWIYLSVRLRSLSIRQDDTQEVACSRQMRRLSFPGILLLALTATFAAFDLIMSLNYAWYSTIFGVYFWTGGIRGSMAMMVLLVTMLHVGGFLKRSITREHLHDCGKLMFAFTIFWAYIGFSQYFLIWYGNVPEETQWYLRRRVGDWYTMSILLPIGYFALPFLMLLPQAFKRSPKWLAVVAVWILFFHAFDLYWQIIPEMYSTGFSTLQAVRSGASPEGGALAEYDFHLYWMSIPAMVLMLGVVVCSALWGMRRFALIPMGDPRLAESLAYHNDTQV